MNTLAPVNPLTLTPSIPTVVTSPEQVAQCVRRAKDAQVAYGALALKERAARLIRFAQLITERRAEGVELIVEETGRPRCVAALSELNNVLAFAKAAIEEAKIALKTTRVKLSPLDFPGKSAIIEQLPRGVIGIIAPWNYPASNFYKSLFPALLSGNSVVMKPSELTPRTGEWLARVAEEVFGPDLVICIQGGAEVGRALIESGIDAIVFTGSVPTGRAVAEACARHLIPCSVELGGKDAALVLEDAALERSALGIAQWSMFNSGQDCSSIERVYVVDAVADRFVEALTSVISSLRVVEEPSQESDIGPLQSEHQLKLVTDHVDSAIQEGAELKCGGAPTGVGYGFQPTVLDRCTDTMSVVVDETFGPVVAVLRVANAAEGVRRINSSRYGLNTSVWTSNLKHGAELARQMECGVALVNNHSFTGSLPQTPWTGVKETGYGVASSRWSYATFTRPRTLVIDKNRDPDPFWFPVDQSYQGFVEAIALKNLGGGLKVIFKLLGLLKTRVKATKKLLK